MILEQEDINSLQVKLLEMLKFFKNFCDENHLVFFLGFGSCLVAIREQGFIPWDDDVDVCMPRPDYDRFVEICKKTDLGDYELVIINETDPYYFEHVVRVFDKNSTILFDSWHTHVSGIFIDVFPIDGAANGDVEINLKKFIFWQKISRFSHMVYPKYKREEILKAGGLSGYFAIIITSMFRKPIQKQSIRKIEKIIRKYSFENSQYCLFYDAIYGMKNVVPKKWIEETIWAPFEDVQVRIPKYYHEYLTHIYGDYMTPPPVEKRDDRHAFAFVDMDKRWSLDEIRKELSKE
jgi:lipopolysaccharide cholinephosphotransferase